MLLAETRLPNDKQILDATPVLQQTMNICWLLGLPIQDFQCRISTTGFPIQDFHYPIQYLPSWMDGRPAMMDAWPAGYDGWMAPIHDGWMDGNNTKQGALPGPGPPFRGPTPPFSCCFHPSIMDSGHPSIIAGQPSIHHG